VTRSESVQIGGTLCIVAVLMAGVGWLQDVRDRDYPPSATAEESLMLTSGTTLRRLTIAWQALAADLYWIRAVQHYGGTKLSLASGGPVAAGGGERRYALLYPLLDVTTSLDPRFNIAYRFGAIFLAEGYPAGPGRPDLAVALLEKGLRERPDKWEYMQDIGFVYYWWLRDYAEAARWFQQAANVPSAPWWLRSLAATTLTQGGDRRSSRLMWESIQQTAENDWLRREAERRLAQLRALDEIDALQGVVDRFAAASGQSPADWMPLVRARLLPGIPVDPAGVAYDLVADRVRISHGSPLFPLPTEPSRMVAPQS
jgi:hypothetical protein